MGLVSGTGVTFSAPTVPAITTDDIYNPDNPSQTLTDLLLGISSAKLLGSAIIDATATGDTTLFTVSANETFLPTDVVFLLTAISGSGSPPLIDVGYADPWTDLVDSSTFGEGSQFTGITAVNQILSFSDFKNTGSNSGADYKALAGGNTVSVSVSTAATYDSYTVKVFVFGFETN
jgi:hypothetical protein